MPSIAEQVASRRTFAIISHPDMPHADFTESERFEGRVLTNFEKKEIGRASCRERV